MVDCSKEFGGESFAAGKDVPGLFKVGVDIVLLSRIRAMAQKHGFSFFQRFLTQKELEYCFSSDMNVQNASPMSPGDLPYSIRSLERAAGRFAAKEAVMKVLGKGWPEISWTDIEVLPDENKRPRVFLGPRLLDRLKSQHIEFQDIEVSITHDGDLAAAIGFGYRLPKTVRRFSRYRARAKRT